MSAQDILAELPHLSVEDRELIAKTLRDLETARETRPNDQQQRTPNLHPGAWEISPDFDDPLPDEFWFGKDE